MQNNSSYSSWLPRELQNSQIGISDYKMILDLNTCSSDLLSQSTKKLNERERETERERERQRETERERGKEMEGEREGEKKREVGGWRRETYLSKF